MVKDKKFYNFVKRIFDLQLALLTNIAISPIMFVLYILIRIKMGKPAMFTQTRAGLNGKQFKLIKFRTMTAERNSHGKLLSDDERVTSFGNLIRKTSLDELPTLLCVIKGDISFVGPRPLHVRYVERYNFEQKKRLNVVPGITGWAQLKGRNALSWDEKFKYDVWYVNNSSFILDIFILVATLVKVFNRSEVSHEGHTTMPEFKRNSVDSATKCLE